MGIFISSLCVDNRVEQREFNIYFVSLFVGICLSIDFDFYPYIFLQIPFISSAFF